MKKIIKPLICLLLLFTIVTSFVSCDYLYNIAYNIMESFEYDMSDLPEGYTGGISYEPHFYMSYEIHWVETFEEAMTVIEHLKAAGNTMPENCIISNYENESVDAKYLFIVGKNGVRKQKDGEEWYERKFDHIEEIKYFGFLDSVTIEELEFSYFDRYKTISLNGFNVEGTTLDNVTYECSNTKVEVPYSPHGYIKCEFKIGDSREPAASLDSCNIESHQEDLPQNFHDDFAKSIVVIK